MTEGRETDPEFRRQYEEEMRKMEENFPNRVCFIVDTKERYSMSEKRYIDLSRSYKKTPVVKDGCDKAGSRKYWKRQAHKKERKTKDLGNKSNNFRKAFDSWNICDYKFYKEKEIGMDEEQIHSWEKWYHRK